MTGCRYDRERAEYVTDDGEVCKRDEYGDRTHHCTARRTCSQHVGEGELTCARCLGRTRTDIRRISELAPLMLFEAVETGVESEAAAIAGPAADPEAWSWRQATRRRAFWAGCTSEDVAVIERALALDLPDDDDRHPLSLLGRWTLMLAEDYGTELPLRINLTYSAGYLDRTLHRMAQDDAQDFPLLAREMRKCRNHLEGVLRDSRQPERGAPCPDCTSEETGVGPRLVREYGHWCYDEDCERLHYLDDSADRWVCPRNRTHEWDVETYSRWIEERRATRRGA